MQSGEQKNTSELCEYVRICAGFHFNTTRISVCVVRLRIGIASSFRNCYDAFVCDYSPNPACMLLLFSRLSICAYLCSYIKKKKSN